MRQHRTIVAALCAVALLAALPLPAQALEYSFAESSGPQYYPATRYAYLYDAEYQYGGPNVIDQKIPELAYGNFSNVSTGIMDTVQDLSMGGMGLGASLTDMPVYIPSKHRYRIHSLSGYRHEGMGGRLRQQHGQGPGALFHHLRLGWQCGCLWSQPWRRLCHRLH